MKVFRHTGFSITTIYLTTERERYIKLRNDPEKLRCYSYRRLIYSPVMLSDWWIWFMLYRWHVICRFWLQFKVSDIWEPKFINYFSWNKCWSTWLLAGKRIWEPYLLHLVEKRSTSGEWFLEHRILRCLYFKQDAPKME